MRQPEVAFSHDFRHGVVRVLADGAPVYSHHDLAIARGWAGNKYSVPPTLLDEAVLAYHHDFEERKKLP